MLIKTRLINLKRYYHHLIESASKSRNGDGEFAIAGIPYIHVDDNAITANIVGVNLKINLLK